MLCLQLMRMRCQSGPTSCIIARQANFLHLSERSRAYLTVKLVAAYRAGKHILLPVCVPHREGCGLCLPSPSSEFSRTRDCNCNKEIQLISQICAVPACKVTCDPHCGVTCRNVLKWSFKWPPWRYKPDQRLWCQASGLVMIRNMRCGLWRMFLDPFTSVNNMAENT